MTAPHQGRVCTLLKRSQKSIEPTPPRLTKIPPVGPVSARVPRMIETKESIVDRRSRLGGHQSRAAQADSDDGEDAARDHTRDVKRPPWR